MKLKRVIAVIVMVVMFTAIFPTTAFATPFGTFELTIEKVGTGDGTVSKSPEQDYYYPLTLVTLSATPDADSTFRGFYLHYNQAWGYFGRLDNNQYLTGIWNQKIYAVFDCIPGFTVKNTATSPENNGTVAVTYNGQTYNLRSQQSARILYVPSAGDARVDFNPDAGYTFVRNTVISGPASYENPTYGTPSPCMTYNIHPQWDQINYTVTFDQGSHGSLTGQTVYNNLHYNDAFPAAPTVNADPGWTFAGWSPGLPANVTGSATYTATYTATAYNITYTMNGGTNNAGNPSTYTVEDAVTLLDPTRAGYNFLGWSPAGSIPAGSTGDKAFEASWSEAIVYNITYTMNGGTNNAGNPAAYTVEDAVTLLDPTRAGYTFLGWSPVSSIPAGSTGDKAFEASWSDAIAYNITYTMNGGTNNAGNPVTYTVNDDTITLLDPTRAGYNFLGWTPVGSIPAGSTGDKAFEATWSDAIEYNITYTMNGGTNNIGNPATYTVEDAITLLDPTRAGYNFLGWTPAGSIPAGSTGDKAFEATWSDAIEYTITYDLDGGSVSVANPTAYNAESADITLNNPTRPGWTFNGWTGTGLSGATLNVTIPTGSTGNRSYTATYTQINYTVTFNVGTNGTTSNPATFTGLHYGDPFPTPPGITANAGWTFNGWPVMPATVTGNASYTAAYTQINYTVTYDVGTRGATLDQTTFTGLHYGDTFPAAPDVDADPGWTFNGWPVRPATVTGNASYTAAYTQINYTVTFVVGANGTTGDQTTFTGLHYGNLFPAEPTVTPNAGWTFDGWPVLPATVTANATYTATYSPISYTVTFVDFNGTVLGTGTVPYGGNAIPPTEPTRDGYTFSGWDKGFNNITADTTITAQYTVNPPAPTMTTIPEEPVPEAPPQQDNNGLWWLLLIPGLLLLLLLLYFNVSVSIFGTDETGREKKLRTIRKLKRKKDAVIVKLKQSQVQGGLYGTVTLNKMFTDRMGGKKLEVWVEDAAVMRTAVPENMDGKFRARIEKLFV
ncbi:MAG: InlB B-repeat-containing protein [Christensenellales bacterium]